MLIFLLPLTNQSYASSTQDKALHIKKLVNSAAKYLKKHGKMQTLCAFNHAHKLFPYNKTYIFAFVCNDKKNNGFVVLDPATPQYNFKQRADTPVIKEMLRKIKKNPQGIWYQYNWLNPKTRKIQSKRSYVIMMPKEKICLGSGYYSTKLSS